MMIVMIMVKINDAPAKSGEGRDDDDTGNAFDKSRDEVAEKDELVMISVSKLDERMF